MSLLDRGPVYQPCEVYMEVSERDTDGNLRTRPSTVPTPAVARFQIQGQSGTSSRRQEQDNEGYETEKVYRVRFPRSFTQKYGVLGAQSQIEWAGKRWAVFGDEAVYANSPRTAHVTYTIKRY